MKSDLTHHGIKGQKWGVRRYRNEDGTLTEAGKRRYGSSSSTQESYGRAKVAYHYNKGFDKTNDELLLSKYKSTKTEKIKDDNLRMAKKRDAVAYADQLTQQTKRTAAGIRNIAQKREQNKLLGKDLSQMTDWEMRDVINRRSLERQYLQATADQRVRGRDYVMDVLDVAGGVLGATGSALAIAIAINTLRNK